MYVCVFHFIGLTVIFCVSMAIMFVTRNPYLGDAWKMLLDAVGSTIQESEQEVLNSITKFVDQLPSVLNEVHVRCRFWRLCNAIYFINGCLKEKNSEIKFCC